MALPDPWPAPEDSQRHALDSQDDFIAAVRQLIPTARRELVIQAAELDTPLFGDATAQSLFAQFVRQSRYCRIRLLFNDASSALRDSHRLITLARQFPSYIQLLRAQPDDQQHRCWLVADSRAVIWRPHAARFSEGHACASAALEARGLLRELAERWERARPDPRLRQLYL